eukprot:scaffold4039_cov124-Isochrysis_galbana.AAC.7
MSHVNTHEGDSARKATQGRARAREEPNEQVREGAPASQTAKARQRTASYAAHGTVLLCACRRLGAP